MSAANEAAKDKPLDLGNRRLPPGIRGGVAKLTACYTKEQDRDEGMVPKGSDFFRAAADVIWPKECAGESLEGATTQKMIALCAVPAKGERKERTFLQNYFDFQNLLRLLGIPACPETKASDPTGERTQAYWFAAMAALTNPRNPPVYISFSTEGWKSPKKAGETDQQYEKREPYVTEKWHGLATKEEVARATAGWTPGGGVSEGPPRATLPTPAPYNQVATPPPAPTTPEESQEGTTSEPDDIEWLVATALEDPDGNTPEGADATSRLEEAAWARGWTREDTSTAANWSVVGQMAQSAPSNDEEPEVAASPEPSTNGAPALGSRWLFRRRNKETGEPLTDRKKQPFAAQEVEVSAVDAAGKTCHLTAGGHPVLDLRSKKPVDVKFEWLESIGY